MPGITDTCYDASKSIHENLNDQAAIMIQIESLEAINNLDAILTEVPDIDAVWLGTLDARVSMGLPANGGMGGAEQEWTDAVATYDRVVAKHGVAKAGFALGTPEMVQNMSKEKSFIMVAADVMAFLGLAAGLATARETIPAIAREGKEATATPTTQDVLTNGVKSNGKVEGPAVPLRNSREVVANGNSHAE